MENITRLTESQLNVIVTKILKEQQYQLPSLTNPYNFNYAPNLLHVNNMCWKNNIKGCIKDNVYTNFDSGYDYKLSKGTWYTKRKGSNNWIDLTNHPNKDIREKSLSILNSKLEKIKKGEKVIKKDDKVIKKDDNIIKKDDNIIKNDTIVSRTANPIFLKQIKQNQNRIDSSKSNPIFRAGQDQCATFVHEYDKTMPKVGNAWIAHDNSSLGNLIFSSFHQLSPEEIKKSINFWLTLKNRGGGEKAGPDNTNISNFVNTLVPSKPPVPLKLGDVVGLFYPDSKHFEEAYYDAGKIFFTKDSKGKTIPGKTIQKGEGWGMNTHVGVVGAIKNGKPIIFHNVKGQVWSDPIDKMFGNCRVAWVRRHGAEPMGLNSPKSQMKQSKDKDLYSSELSEHFKNLHKKKSLVEQKSDYMVDRQSNAIMNASGIRSNSNYEKVNKIIKNTETRNYSGYYEKYKCLPENFRIPFGELIKEGYNKGILKAALGIIGRESSYTNSKTYNLTYLPKLLIAFTNRSLGPAQMKPSTAHEIGALYDNILSMKGSLKAAYKYLIRSYKRAKEKGYSTTSPSVNLQNGTGNAALDISIGSYNFGLYRIFKYCETNDPNIKKDCAFAGKTVDSKNNIVTKPTSNSKTYKVSSKYVPNYFPKIGDTSVTGNKLTSEGYISEVAKSIRSFNCV